MGGDVEDAGIAVKARLSAVAVVNVKIGYRKPFQIVFGSGIGGGHGHVIEKAESPRAIAACMVPRRADKSKNPSQLSRTDGVDTLQYPARCQQGGLIALNGYRSVGIEVRGGVFGRLLDAFDMAVRMNKKQLFNSGFAGGQAAPASPSGKGLQSPANGHESLRGFRMVGTGIVEEVTVV
jgi:hypothetical protein